MNKEEKLNKNAKIRKVSILKGRAKKEADEMDLEPNDLVIVRTTIPEGRKLPQYDLEKIEGDPFSYMFDRPRKEGSESEE